MAVYGESAYSEADIPQLIGVKTNIGGYFFDAVLKVDHNSKLKITDHPVEEGANIADHAFLEAQNISMEIGMSDCCVSYVAGQFEQAYTRSVSAFRTLKQLQADRIPLSVHTRLETYHNMLIETITSSDDWMTQNGMKAMVTLREIPVARLATVEIPIRASASPHTTGSANRGTVRADYVYGKGIYESTLDKMMGINSKEKTNAIGKELVNNFLTPTDFTKKPSVSRGGSGRR